MTEIEATDQREFSLYGYPQCPYCRSVMQAIDSLGMEIELRNTMENRDYQQEVVQATGRGTVPVLRIDSGDDTQWMPESSDIVAYLNQVAQG